MPTEDYSKRELDGKFLLLQTSVDNMSVNQTTAHKTMIEQLKLTNGRVKKLELWKAGLVGSVAVLSVVVVPVLIWLLNNYTTTL